VAFPDLLCRPIKTTPAAAHHPRQLAKAHQILTTVGVQPEAHLPFAGLHQLLRPIHERIDRLPVRPRDAVRAAFGITDATVPDLFLIALVRRPLHQSTAGTRQQNAPTGVTRAPNSVFRFCSPECRDHVAVALENALI
jgi:hypothetical protein